MQLILQNREKMPHKVQANFDLTPLLPTVSALYHSRGITSLYPWYTQRLSLPGVIDAFWNLVNSAPTSGWKSFIADILLYNTLSIRHKLAIISVPFASIAAEISNSTLTLRVPSNFVLNRVLISRAFSQFHPLSHRAATPRRKHE
ncbi:hypothetical protein BLNAU_22088 [Blattamonas nauphoetae]|uniref:Uncharacterized protein n=1 Tax=Blattamonas nauphoetae TaxID=2049346 RepID=A0ABQ9WU33_9EUKA|nr:hypothetical protein BLNAU_22088 [Blattamonas nauphoetae]